MRGRIKDSENLKATSVDWLGFFYSIGHIKAVYNKELHDLKVMLQNEVYLKKSLKDVGFSENQLVKILETGNYIKDHGVLKKMEKNKSKKKK